jgi:hypothetical protein
MRPGGIGVSCMSDLNPGGRIGSIMRAARVTAAGPARLRRRDGRRTGRPARQRKGSAGDRGARGRVPSPHYVGVRRPSSTSISLSSAPSIPYC